MSDFYAVDQDRALYVLRCGNGYTTVGIGRTHDALVRLAAAYGVTELPPTATPEHYDAWRTLDARALLAMRSGTLHPAYRWENGTAYGWNVPDAVVRELEWARVNGAPVRLFYGDRDTGRSWMDENDVTGTVERSTGLIKTPLLIVKPRDTGGGAILCNAVVRLDARNPASGAVRTRYAHPRFHVPTIALRTSPEHAAPGYPVAALVNGEVHARFATMGKAERWRAFIVGERFTK